MDGEPKYRIVEMDPNGILTDDGTADIPEEQASLWMTREEVSKICPACAEKMKKRNIIRIRSSVLYNDRTAAAVFNGCPECVEDLR